MPLACSHMDKNVQVKPKYMKGIGELSLNLHTKGNDGFLTSRMGHIMSMTH